MYAVNSVNIGTSKDPFLTQVSDFAVLFGNQLDAEVYVYNILEDPFCLKLHLDLN